MKSTLISYLVICIYKLLQWSWRIEIRESDGVKKLMADKESFVIAHWHGDELGVLHLLKPYHVACIISTSKDGDIMNRAVRLLGGQTVRGSSTRGGAQALKGIIRLKKQGWRPSVAVDGPKGPIYKVKPGILQISRLAQLPIVPLSFYASKVFTFEKSWNKSRLPLPFSKVVIQWGHPLRPISKEQSAKQDDLLTQVEQAINATKEWAAQPDSYNKMS